MDEDTDAQGQDTSEQMMLSAELETKQTAMKWPTMAEIQAKKNGTTAVKFCNKLGGKTPQLGPRIRDVKKAARGGAHFQQVVSRTKGPKGVPTKENLNPNNKASQKTLSPIRDFEEIAQELRRR